MRYFIVLALLLTTGSLFAQNVYTDNVIIVLDNSGSMGQRMSGSKITRMEAAKKALHQVLTQVPDTTQVGLLIFGQTSRQKDWMYPLATKSQELDKAIDKPQPMGGTPLGQYIKNGADRLLAERKKQLGYGSYRLMIVTDGEASDPQNVERYVPDVISRGITVDVIGVDMKSTHTLATKVHSYRNAKNPDSLKQAIKEIMAEVSSDSNDKDDAEAYELIAPLPDEIAHSMLETLAQTGNQPIGTK